MIRFIFPFHRWFSTNLYFYTFILYIVNRNSNRIAAENDFTKNFPKVFFCSASYCTYTLANTQNIYKQNDLLSSLENIKLYFTLHNGLFFFSFFFSFLFFFEIYEKHWKSFHCILLKSITFPMPSITLLSFNDMIK